MYEGFFDHDRREAFGGDPPLEEALDRFCEGGA